METFSRRAFLAASLAAFPAWPAVDEMVPIFDGKTLDGWQQLNGSAKYEASDGMIVGTTTPNSANSFLCTKKSYGDFVLEFEAQVDGNLNSGVQIRSHQYRNPHTSFVWRAGKWWERNWPTGRVHGYQVEIANKTHASGGIFDEGERGWLQEVTDEPAASTAFNDNQWNKFRVAATGDSVRTWVNGVPCVDLTDPEDQSGFIGLQVHEFPANQKAQVRFRNLRIADLGVHVWRPFQLDAPHFSNDPDATIRLQFKTVKGSGVLQFRGFEAILDGGQRVGQLLEAGTHQPVVNSVLDRAYQEGVAHYYRPGDWNQLAIAAHGSRILVHVNGIRTADVITVSGAHGGRLGLAVPNGSEVLLKDAEILEPK